MTDQKGQSLVEMIVIVGMVVLLMTGIVAGTTVSLSRSETSQVRSVALSHAQSGIELARAKRDSGWAAFALLGTSPTTYCVGADGVFNTGLCTINMDGKYIRSVSLQLTAVSLVSTMKVTSRVVWGDTANPSNAVQLTTYLTEWK
jgi:type II secretory pathway pseudopilin PulG